MTKMQYIYTLIFTLLLISPSYGQNYVDQEGRKTGHWIVKYPNGNTQYEATFQAGKPVGLMKRYYDNGGVSAEMTFEPGGEICFARLYHQKNKLAACGWFIGQKKDSVWTYYSEYDEHIILREPYKDGNLNGIAESYYPSGKVTEQTTWVDNKKNGSWIIYFEDGGVRSSGTHKNGMREGLYSTYYPDSTLELTGNYKDNVADGDWNLYDEEGILKFTYKYKAGKLLNESELINSDDEMLRKFKDLPDPKDMIDF